MGLKAKRAPPAEARGGASPAAIAAAPEPKASSPDSMPRRDRPRSTTRSKSQVSGRGLVISSQSSADRRGRSIPVMGALLRRAAWRRSPGSMDDSHDIPASQPAPPAPVQGPPEKTAGRSTQQMQRTRPLSRHLIRHIGLTPPAPGPTVAATQQGSHRRGHARGHRRQMAHGPVTETIPAAHAPPPCDRGLFYAETEMTRDTEHDSR